MAVFTIFLVLLTTTILWHRSKKPSNPSQIPLPPGPRGLPLVGSLPFLDPNLHRHFARLAAAYGPIFHIKLGQKLMVVVSSPSLAKEVLKEQDPILANRDVPANIRYMPNAAHGIGWTPNGDKWRSLRKLAVGELLHGAKQRSYHSLRRVKLHQTLKQVVAKVGSPIIIHDLVCNTSFEILTHMLWGGEGFMAKGGRGVQEEFRKGLEEFNQVAFKPNLRDFFPVMGVCGLMFGVDRENKEVGDKFERLLDVIVTERAKTISVDGEKLDFLSTLLQIKEGDTKTTLTTADIKGILMVSFLFDDTSFWTIFAFRLRISMLSFC